MGFRHLITLELNTHRVTMSLRSLMIAGASALACAEEVVTQMAKGEVLGEYEVELVAHEDFVIPSPMEFSAGDFYYISRKEADHLTHEAGVGAHEFYQMVKPKFLGAHDPVAVSFWIISICMVAATVFFVYECLAVNDHWRTSLTVGALVTLVAAVHYFYMREYWVTYYQSPTVYRYIDWTITVPLQMIEFYLILSAVGKVPAGVFWRLLVV